VARGRCAFKESDVTRLLKAAKKAGVEFVRVEIEDGKISVVAGKPNDEAVMQNPWDEIYAPDQKRSS
jgi:hypothetical protein